MNINVEQTVLVLNARKDRPKSIAEMLDVIALLFDLEDLLIQKLLEETGRDPVVIGDDVQKDIRSLELWFKANKDVDDKIWWECFG